MFKSRSRFQVPLQAKRAPLLPFGGLVGALGLTLVPMSPAQAIPDHATYDLVLGQGRLSQRRVNTTDDRGLATPVAVAVDRRQTPYHLYIADSMNGRVLGYRDVSSFKNGAPPDLILGQADEKTGERLRTDGRSIGSPSGLAVDKNGTLYVSDAANGRVLGFLWPFDPAAPLADRLTADVLIGQADFGLGYPDKACNGAPMPHPEMPAGAASASMLCSPSGLAVDGDGSLYVADRRNHRVLYFKAPIQAKMAQAERVFGQEAMTGTSLCNRGGSANAQSLCSPASLLYTKRTGEAGRLYVVDTDNNRVLAYEEPFGAAAKMVFGQPSMTVVLPGGGTDGLSKPLGIAMEEDGTLWIGDGNHRLLGFAPPFLLTGSTASYVLGQMDGNGNQPNQGTQGRPVPPPTAYTLYTPWGLSIDDKNRLLVADSGNHRVLVYGAPKTTSYAIGVLGQADFFHGAENRAKAASLAYPVGIAVDRPDPATRPGEAIHVYVADFLNNRVLGWRSLLAMKNGMPADLVLGQKSFSDTYCNLGRGVSDKGLCSPRGLSVDKDGNLWVADTWNHRVVRFPRPFDNYKAGEAQSADRVLGQPSLLSGLPNINGLPTPSIRSMNGPVSLAMDPGPAGTLWVADRDNDRVMGFMPPFENGIPAARVLAGFERNENQTGCPMRGNGGYVCAPSSVAVDPEGDIWVADRDNNRVALYRTVPLSTDSPLISPVPIAVIGQADIVKTGANHGVVDKPQKDSLRAPEAVTLETRPAVSGEGKPFVTVAIVVADTGNNRVLIFEPMRAGFQPQASAVLGQDNKYDTRQPNLDGVNFEAPQNLEKGLYAPGGVVALPEALLIADSGDLGYLSPKAGHLQPQGNATGNNRILLIKGPSFPKEVVDMAAPVDMAQPADMSVPPLDKGCTCRVSGRSADRGGLAWLLISVGLVLGLRAAARRRVGRVRSLDLFQ